MAEYRAPVADMVFNLFDVLALDRQWQELPELRERVSRDLVEAVLEGAASLVESVLAPINRSGDEEGCSFSEGVVRTPAGFREAFQQYAEGGWIGLGGDPEYGGAGLPKVVVVLLEEMLFAANSSFALYPILTAGAAMAIATHAEPWLRDTYLPRMYRGEWAGAMCLTEPHAGSDLGLLTTRAVPLDEQRYALTGTKIFITGGEQDLTENIVHLVLARLPDAPEGSRGISLFLVPKFMPTAEGGLGERNAVHCGAIEHKMGIKASATCVINFDGAIGYLVGSPNRGLAAMFTMMNYERLSMAQQGLGLGDAAYQSALAYAQERRQGRAAVADNGAAHSPVAGPTTALDFDPGPDSIIGHGDVQRTLLTMRAFNEGGRCFTLFVAQQLDIASHHPDAATRARADKLAQLLTPVAKAFLSDRGFDNCVRGQQLFGGHGYVREWGMEQLVRDARIAQIYEGTNGIQALDLIDRKLVRDGGEGWALLRAAMQQTVTRAGADGADGAALGRAVELLDEVSQWLLAESSAGYRNAVAVDYLDLFGLVCLADAWTRMRIAVAGRSDAVADAKRQMSDFFFTHLLPQADFLAVRVRNGGVVQATSAVLIA